MPILLFVNFERTVLFSVKRDLDPPFITFIPQIYFCLLQQLLELFSSNNLELQQLVENILSNLVVHYISFAYFSEIRTYRLYLVNPVRNKFLSQTNLFKK